MAAVTRPVVWITGVNGFSGRAVSAYLKEASIEAMVVGSDVSAQSSARVDEYVQSDILDVAALEAVVAQYSPTHVMHLAGVLPPADAAALWETNVGGTLNLVRALSGEKANKTRLLLVGSAAEYAEKRDGGCIDESAPLYSRTRYGRSKLAQSTAGMASAISAGLHCTIVRAFNLLGPGISASLLPGTLLRQFSDPAAKELRVGDIECERDFIDIRDAVSAYWMVLSGGQNGRVYNVCSGKTISVRYLIDLFQEESRRNLTLRVDEGLINPDTVRSVRGSCERLKQELGWQARISIRQSVRDMLASVDV